MEGYGINKAFSLFILSKASVIPFCFASANTGLSGETKYQSMLLYQKDKTNSFSKDAT